MAVFPLNEQTRQQLAELLLLEIGTRDPLPFLQKNIFANYPKFNAKILPPMNAPSGTYYSLLIRNIELSAWSVRPPLLVSLMRALPQAQQLKSAIDMILSEGPFQCHPQNEPHWVCRVATELPLVGRDLTRAAGMAFDITVAKGNKGKRVLRVFGPPGSGKTHTLTFFKYLENVQPLVAGVVSIDFKDVEVAAQAANADGHIELFLAERLEAQMRHHRAELEAGNPTDSDFPDLLALANSNAQPHRFRPLSEVQQRVRWAKELANEFVDDVLFALVPQPAWWVVAFDNCELAPPESHEFIRRLVERAAGTTTDTSSVSSADTGQLRVVLLGDSSDLLPANLYKDHVIVEDLTSQQLGVKQVQRYFITFSQCREDALTAAQIQELTDATLARANEIAAQPSSPPVSWPRALATAIIEKTLPLDQLATQKKGGV